MSPISALVLNPLTLFVIVILLSSNIEFFSLFSLNDAREKQLVISKLRVLKKTVGLGRKRETAVYLFYCTVTKKRKHAWCYRYD